MADEKKGVEKKGKEVKDEVVEELPVVDVLSNVLLLELSVESFKMINERRECEARTVDGQRVIIRILG